MKFSLFFIALIYVALSTTSMYAQNVGIGTTAPSPSALLDLTSSEKGVLLPRMTRANRDLIEFPASSLLIYQTNETPGFFYNAGNALAPDWVRISRRRDTLVVGAEAFFPRSSSTAYVTSALSSRYIPTDGSTESLRAPVFLPAGVSVKTMRVFFYDRSSSSNIELELRANYLALGAVTTTSFTYSSSGSSESVRSATITGDYLVKSDQFSYYINASPSAGTWNFDADLSIKGVMLIYEY